MGVNVKRLSSLITIYNIFSAFIQIYKIIEYIYSVNITQNTMASKSFLWFSIINLVIVIFLNIGNFAFSRNKKFTINKLFIASFIFVCLTYLVSFGIILLY